MTEILGPKKRFGKERIPISRGSGLEGFHCIAKIRNCL